MPPPPKKFHQLNMWLPVIITFTANSEAGFSQDVAGDDSRVILTGREFNPGADGPTLGCHMSQG